jgi:hypothetical protein
MNYPDYQPPSPPVKKVGDIYLTSDPLIPAGWEPTGEFRPTVGNEPWLGTDGTVYKEQSGYTPRIILRKIKRIVFTYLRTDYAKQGEWYASGPPEATTPDFMYYWGLSLKSSYKHKIYQRSEE